MASCAFISIRWGYGLMSVPFSLIFAGGYFYVGFSSLYALYRMNQEAVQEIPEPDAAPIADVS